MISARPRLYSLVLLGPNKLMGSLPIKRLEKSVLFVFFSFMSTLFSFCVLVVNRNLWYNPYLFEEDNYLLRVTVGSSKARKTVAEEFNLSNLIIVFRPSFCCNIFWNNISCSYWLGVYSTLAASRPGIAPAYGIDSSLLVRGNMTSSF
jgi:hypothetical protein